MKGESVRMCVCVRVCVCVHVDCGLFSYPEVDVEVPAAAKLPITCLEGDGHAVILVQFLVEAFPRVRPEEDVM